MTLKIDKTYRYLEIGNLRGYVKPFEFLYVYIYDPRDTLQCLSSRTFSRQFRENVGCKYILGIRKELEHRKSILML